MRTVQGCGVGVGVGVAVWAWLFVMTGAAHALCGEEGVAVRLARLEKLVQQQQERMRQQEGLLKTREARIAKLENTSQSRSGLEARIANINYFDVGAADAASGAGPAPNDFRAYWDKGLRLSSQNGNFKVKFGGRIMQDYVFDSTSNELDRLALDTEDGAEARRARIYFSGHLYKNIIFKLQYDFANGNLESKDVYLGIRHLPAVGTWRVGHFKEPFGLEELTSSKYITFLERSLPSEAFAPSRNPGMMFNNHHLSDRLTWAVGVFREASDNRAREDDGYNVSGRVTGLPYYKDGSHLLHLGAAFSLRNPNDNLRRLRSRAGQHLAPNRFADTGNFSAEAERRAGVELAGVWGSASFQAEYMAAWVKRRNSASGPASGYAFFSGGYAQFSYWITGEHRKYKKKHGTFSRVSPKRNFLDGKGGLGAFELAARYSYLDLTDDGVDGGRLNNFTAGVNWHLNPNTRIMLNYAWNTLDRQAASGQNVNGSSNSLSLRFQLDF